jgi:PAS domain-containing protein
MENEKNTLLARLNPWGFNLKVKIHLLVFSSVLFTILITVVIGFAFMRESLLKSVQEQLEELTYLKSAAIEQKYNTTREKLLGFINEQKLVEATEKFKSDFKSLMVEKSGLFSADSLNEMKSRLAKYYEEEITTRCPVSGSKISQLLPLNDNTVLAQYLFLVKLNQNAPDQKSKTITYSDNSEYARTHSEFHPYMLNICNKLDADDLYVIDPLTGDVVYSINKDIDFGNNLYNGKLRISPLATAFRAALASSYSAVSFVDYSIYAPALDRAVAFLSVPVYSDNRLISIIVVRLGTGFLEHVLFDKYLLATEGSFEYTVIGKDMLLRNNPRGFISNEKTYLHSLERHASRLEIDKISAYRISNNMAMLVQYPFVYKSAILSDQNLQIKDYLNNRVVASVKNFEIQGNEFLIITKINYKDALKDYFRLLKIFVFVILILLIGFYFVGNGFAKTLFDRIAGLKDSLINLYRGEQPKLMDPGDPDEVAEAIIAFNELRTRINETAEFAIEMSEGNFNHEFKALSDSDSLGKSLNVLKLKMIQSKEEQDRRQKEDETRNWLNNGIAKFNDLLRKNNNNIEVLSYSLIENLVTYIGANQGGVFLVESESASQKYIRMVASYAYDRRKYNKKTIEIGEGLLGNIYLEKKSIYLKDIPEDYIEIRSGLGHSAPRCLYITPLKVEEDVLGMIEIGSLNELEPHHIELLERVSESIAGTFISVRLNMQTTRLLEESNRRTEEITQQEEEMRQNLEEMQATQEELARLRQDDEKRTREMQLNIENARRMLKDVMNSIPGGYVLKDANGIILLANNEGAEFYDTDVENLLGKTDYELLNNEMFELEHKSDLEVIAKGEKKYSETKVVNNEKIKFNVTKKPFSIAELRQSGILTIRYKVE